MSYRLVFAETNVSSFYICKSYSHLFSAKNTCELAIVLTRTVNILITNKHVKLTMLSTTGPWKTSYWYSSEVHLLNTLDVIFNTFWLIKMPNYLELSIYDLFLHEGIWGVPHQHPPSGPSLPSPSCWSKMCSFHFSVKDCAQVQSGA